MPHRPVVALFTLAAFTGSGLLFFVQPMFARLVLPHLGGSPSVWNACMLFFQAVLLLGYLYAHLASRALTVRVHSVMHLAVLCAPLAVFPLVIGSPVGALAEWPTAWLLVTAACTVGPPYFVLSTSAPLLQRWFAALPHPSARDPYFLYAASNLGSLLALLGYPFVFEPMVGLLSQTRAWSWSYGVFVVLTAACAVVVRRLATAGPPAAQSYVSHSPASWRQRLFWLAMAFVPSTLMLGVTSHISTDIAAFPLLWIVPLSLYLLTFVVAFSARPVRGTSGLAAVTGLLAFATFVLVTLKAQPMWAVGLHLLTFAAVALLCHVRLAQSRPVASRLTEFYLWLSAGGALGGVFNSLVAPVLFSTVVEYPLALAAAVVVAARSGIQPLPVPSSVKHSLSGLAVLTAVAALMFPGGPRLRIPELIGSTVLVVLTIIERRNLGALRTVMMISAALGVASTSLVQPAGVAINTERSFFGVHRVRDAEDGSYRALYHGSTLHGWQGLQTEGCEPASYYSRKGPIGDIFAAAGEALDRVAIVGLGTGALACYAQAGDVWTFYEIDPVVARLARNPAYFHQITRSSGQVEVVIADGRLGLRSAPAGIYDLIILDAFSSDAIPVHLLTQEAFELYFSRLTPGGTIAIHISNRFLDLEPPLAALVREARLQGYVRSENRISDEDARRGRIASTWVVLARPSGDMLGLGGRTGWRALRDAPDVRVWTDDYANVLQALF